MSLLLVERNQLVTPVESVAQAPPRMRMNVVPLEPDLPEAPSEPGFLLAARELAAAHPQSVIALARLAQAELARANRDLALNAARKAISLAGRGDTSASLGAAQVLIATGSPEEAEEALETLNGTPSTVALRSRVAVSRGDLERALEILEGLETFEALSVRGWIKLVQQDFPGSIALFRKALKRYGLHASLLANLGYAYAALGALPKAIRVTKEARQLDPQSDLIAFNLASYYRALGQLDLALAEVRRLRGETAGTLGLVFAEADLLLAFGDAVGAEKALRRARTSQLWVSANLRERSELEANLAFVRWRLGSLDRHETRSEVIQQLKRSEFHSLAVTSMLPVLMRESSDAEELEEIYHALGEVHPGVPFDQLRTHLAILHSDFRRATEIAVEWAKDAVFDATAAAMAVYLLTDVESDLDGAISIGREALRRTPSSKPLMNNVAYALALSGRYEEARRILPAQTDDVHLTATRALIDFLGGNERAGAAGYQRAAKLAVEANEPELARLVRYNELLCRARWLRQHANAESVQLELPADWRNHPNLELIRQIAEREGVPYTVSTEESKGSELI